MNKIKTSFPQEIESARVEKDRMEVAVRELSKITTSDTKFSLEKRFYDFKPYVYAAIKNDSKYQISTLKWRLKLYIDDKKEPVATSENYDFYEKGLLPGTSEKRTFHINDFEYERQWKTLEIQNAKVFKATLEILPEDAEDFSNKKIVNFESIKRFDYLTKTLATAKEYEDI